MLKFVGDFYGREQSTPERRRGLRQLARLNFSDTVTRLEERLRD